MLKKGKKIILIALIVASMSISLGYYVYNNTIFLLTVAWASDIPSQLNFWARDRIYQKCQDVRVVNSIVDDFKSNRLPYLNDIYILVLGVIGDKKASDYIVRELVAAIDNNNYGTVAYCIDSLGLLGDANVHPLLIRLMDNYESYKLPLPKYVLFRSIYLISGNIDEYPNSNEKPSGFAPNDELVFARKIILSSNDRYRTLDEMHTLDKLLRPAKWQ
jgi:hypothetical protein